MKKKIAIVIIITLIVACGLAALVFSTFHGRHYIDPEGAVLSGYRDATPYALPPNKEYEVRQLMIASQPRLSQITIPVESGQAGEMRLTLKTDPEQTVIRQATLPLPIAQVAVPITWSFAPVDGSSGQHYWLEISGRTGDTAQKFLAIAPVRYDGGDLFINNELQTDQRLVVDWQYYTPNAWVTATERLTYAKPDLWNHRVTILIIIIGLFITTLAVAALFTYATLASEHE